MSLSSTDSNNNGFNINDDIDINEDVRENFWNAIWTLINIKIPSNTDTYKRVSCATSIWNNHVTEEDDNYKLEAKRFRPNPMPNYTDIYIAANEPFNYRPAQEMVELMVQKGVNPQAKLEPRLYHTPTRNTGGSNKRRRPNKRRRTKKSKRRRKQRKTRRK